LELKKKVVSGIFWTAISNVGGVVLSFSLGVWLARLLGPPAYGLINMVLVVAGFGRLLLDFGFGEALIQKRDVDQQDYSSVFWFNILVAIGLTAAFFFCSPIISSFYHKPDLLPICQVMSLSFLLNGAVIVQRIKLEKAFKYKLISAAELGSTLSSTALAIYLAIQGYGVWSLVILNLSKSLIYGLIIWVSSQWLPTMMFQFDRIKKLSRFSLALMANGSFNTLATSLDKLLLGRFKGEMSLGLYSKSYSTIRLPVNQVTYALSRVMYPAFSEIQDKKSKIFEVYGKIIRVISYLLFPVMAVFIFFGESIVIWLFGADWTAMTPIFRILAITAGFIPFNIFADSIVKSQGSVKHLNLITFIEKPLVIVATIIGIASGSVITLSWSLAICVFVVFLIKSNIVSLVLNKPLGHLLLTHIRALGLVVLPVLAMSLVLWSRLSYGISTQIAIFLTALTISAFLLRKQIAEPIIEVLNIYRKPK
jgi:PST family polysaccharide transporter